jgi:EAL domain-containing protein (putative c-di-GMP-specific phosphodiesterase class I)
VGVDDRMTALVRMLAQTTRALGMGLVAEGVEDEAHARNLRSIGCEKMQGFWFARPMPAEAMDSHLRESPGRSQVA